MKDDKKRFDNWDDCYEVDCNSCEHYYTNSCDGVPEGKKRTCTAFKASRGIVIPQEIEMLKTSLKSLERRILLLNIGILLGAIGVLIHLFS